MRTHVRHLPKAERPQDKITIRQARTHTYLDESDASGLLAEAAAADVQTVLADEPSAAAADTALARAWAVLLGVRVHQVGHGERSGACGKSRF